VAVFGNVFFETRVEQLFDLARLVETIFAAAGVEYRVIGGLAVYLYVEDVDPDAGRLTRDVDIVIRRQDLEKASSPSRDAHACADGRPIGAASGAPGFCR